MDTDGIPQIAVSAPPVQDDADMSPMPGPYKPVKLLGTVGLADAHDDYGMLQLHSARSSMASVQVGHFSGVAVQPSVGERSGADSNRSSIETTPEITFDVAGNRRSSKSSNKSGRGRLGASSGHANDDEKHLQTPQRSTELDRPSILVNNGNSPKNSSGLSGRLSEAAKVVRMASWGIKSKRGSDATSSRSSTDYGGHAVGKKRSTLSSMSSFISSERNSLVKLASPIRAFFRPGDDDNWETYLFGHSLSEVANMRRLGNKAPDDSRLIQIMTAMNDFKHKRQEQVKAAQNRRHGGGSKFKLREEEDAATMLRDSSIHWSYFDIFEKDIGDDSIRQLRMIRAFSRFATWSRAVAKTICMWSIWYSTCLFFFWDVMADDRNVGRTTAIWVLLQAFDLSSDIVFLFITLSRLVTTIADATSGVEICLPERVIWKVLNRGSFWIDLTSSFPWTLCCSSAPSVFPRWLALIKTLRGWHIFERSHTWLVFQQDLNTIPLLLSVIFLFGHVLACVYYYLILDGIPVPDRGNMFPEWNFVQCYMYSYRICVYLLLGEDMEDITTSGDFFDANLGRLGYIQDLFVVFCMPIGSLINALVFSQIIVIVQRRSALETIHIEHENQLRQTMISYDLPSSLQLRMLAYYKYEKIHQAHATFGTIFKNLSPQLNFELRLFLYYEQVTGVPLFESCQPKVLRELVLRLNDRLFLPGDYICRFGDKGEEMYFICKGACSVIAEDMSHVLAELGPGGHFGEIAVIMGQKRTAYVRADGFCLTASLTKDNFEEIMREFPEELRVILSKMSSEKKQQIQDIGRNSISAGVHGLKINVSKLQEASEANRRRDTDTDEEDSESSSSTSSDEGADGDQEAPGELPASRVASSNVEKPDPTSESFAPVRVTTPVIRRPSVLKNPNRTSVNQTRNRSVSILDTAQVHHTDAREERAGAENGTSDGKRRVSFAGFDTQHLMHDIHETGSNGSDSSAEDADPLMKIMAPTKRQAPNIAAVVVDWAPAAKKPLAEKSEAAKNIFGTKAGWGRIRGALNFRSGKDATESSKEASKESANESAKESAKQPVEEVAVPDIISPDAPLTLDEVVPSSSSRASPMPPQASPPQAGQSPAQAGLAPREAWGSAAPGVDGLGALGLAASSRWASPCPRPPPGGRRRSVASHSLTSASSSTSDATSPRCGPPGLRRISLGSLGTSAFSKQLADPTSGPLAAIGTRQPLLCNSARGSVNEGGDDGAACSSAVASSCAPAGASTMDGDANPQKVSALLDAGGFGDGVAERSGEAIIEPASASDIHGEKKRSTLTVPSDATKHRHKTSSRLNSSSPTGSLVPVRPPNRKGLLNSEHSSPTDSNSLTNPSMSSATGSAVSSVALGEEGNGAPDPSSTLPAPKVKTHQELAKQMDQDVEMGRREAKSNLGSQLKTLNKAVDELVDVQLKVSKCIKSMETDSVDLEKALNHLRSLWQDKAKALQRDDLLFQEFLEDIKLHVEAAHEGVELLLEDVRGEFDNQEIDLAAQAMNIVNSQREEERPLTPLLSPPEPEVRRRKSSSIGMRVAEAKDGQDGKRETIAESKPDSSQADTERRRRPSMRESRPGTPGAQDDNRSAKHRHSVDDHRRSFSYEDRPNMGHRRSNVNNLVL